jgi:S-adenosylmethionine synthetase
MSLEATAGKNPVSHVGKIYNVLAARIANRIYEETKGIQEVYVKVLSRIGNPIDQPAVADIELILEPGYNLTNVEPEVRAIADDEIENIQKITELVIKERVRLF